MPLKPSFFSASILAVLLGLAVLLIIVTAGIADAPVLPPGATATVRKPVDRPTKNKIAVPLAKPAQTPASPPISAAAAEPSPLAATGAPAGTVPTAPRASEIHGTVLNPGNNPVPDVEVILSNSLGRLKARSGPRGGFRFAPLPAGTFALRAFHPDYAPHVEKGIGLPIQLAAGESRRISLRLENGLAVEGVVVARDGTGPVGGACLTMVRAEFDGFLATTTRPDGTFRFGHFPVLPEEERPFPIEVTAKGFAPAYVAVDARNRPPVHRVEIGLDRGAGIHGTVTDQYGKPLAGTDIRCKFRYRFVRKDSEITVRTDHEGRYRVHNLPRGFVIQVWAFKKGHHPNHLNLVLSDPVHDKAMRPLRLKREDGS